MKQFFSIIISSFLLTASAYALEGTFKGEGVWEKANGETGMYEVSTTFADAQTILTNKPATAMKTDYLFIDEEGKKKTMYIGLLFAENESGVMEITERQSSTKIGEGMCDMHTNVFYEQYLTCHYNYSMDNVKVDESFTYDAYNGVLYRSGSMNHDGQTMIWFEKLYQIAW